LEVQSQDCKKTETKPDPDRPGPEIPRTVEDRNHGPVFGLTGFWKFQDREKTGLTGLNQSLQSEKLPKYVL